jgi:hypothetical protein
MAEQDQPELRRWYDLDPTVSKAVRLLESFPSDIQTLISEGALRLAEQECRINELMANLRSLGPEKVLGIHKSKNKRRAYDQNLAVHHAMNALYALSQVNRQLIGERVLDLMNCILEYIRVCKGYEIDPSVEEVGAIAQAYVELGPEEAKALLQYLEKRFKNKLNRVTKDELLREDSQGMRVREELPPG